MKSQIDQLKSEAEANLNASRWEDSAKTYEHLVGLAQENNDLELAIDFAIAAIKCWNKMVDKEARINKLYQAIGLISLKKAAIGYEELAKKAEHEKNQKIAALNYEEAAEGYNYILNFDRAKKCYTISISYLTELCNDTLKNKDYEISIHLFDKLSNLHGKLSLLIDRILLQVKDLDKNTRQSLLEEKSNALNLVKNAKMNIAMAHEYLALNYIKNKDLDYRQIAEKEYQNAIKILESIGEIQEAKKIELRKSKVLK